MKMNVRKVSRISSSASRTSYSACSNNGASGIISTRGLTLSFHLDTYGLSLSLSIRAGDLFRRYEGANQEGEDEGQTELAITCLSKCIETEVASSCPLCHESTFTRLKRSYGENQNKLWLR